MEKMTIHRALAELKLIGSRIDKAIDEFMPTGIYQEGRKVGNSNYTKEEFEKLVKEKYQSVTDLINRKNAIKSAIVKANSVTLVTIAGKQLTIADAINLRGIIAIKKTLAESMKAKHRHTLAVIEKHNAKVDADALTLASTALQKKEVKINDTDVKQVIDPFIKMNSASLIDPLDVNKEIEKFDLEVSSFEAEVDATLSEINATTFIEI